MDGREWVELGLAQRGSLSPSSAFFVRLVLLPSMCYSLFCLIISFVYFTTYYRHPFCIMYVDFTVYLLCFVSAFYSSFISFCVTLVRLSLVC